MIPTEDVDISKEMKKLLTKKGITIVTGAKVSGGNSLKNRGICHIIMLKFMVKSKEFYRREDAGFGRAASEYRRNRY